MGDFLAGDMPSPECPLVTVMVMYLSLGGSVTFWAMATLLA